MSKAMAAEGATVAPIPLQREGLLATVVRVRVYSGGGILIALAPRN